MFYRSIKSPIVWAVVLLGCTLCLLIWLSPRDPFLEGIKYLRNGKSSEALESFRRATDKNPMNACAWYYIAYIRQKTDGLDAAIKDYEEALKIHQQIVDMQNRGQGGSAEPENETPKGAVPQDAVTLDSELIYIYAVIGKYSLAREKWDEAVDYCTKALQLDSYNAEVFYTRGAAFAAKGFKELAIGDLSMALYLDSQNEKYLCKRAELYNSLPAADQGINDCIQAIKLNPESAEAFYIMGSAYASRNNPDWERAEASFEEALHWANKDLGARIRSDLAILHFRHGKFLYKRKKYDPAQKAFDRAISLDRGYAAAVAGFLSKDNGNNEQTLRITTEKMAPERTSLGEGFALLDQNQLDKAIGKFAEAIEKNPQSAEAYFGRGLSFLEKNFPDTAVGDFNDAIALDENYADAYCQRARAQTRLGNYASAINDCTRAIRLKPDSGLAYYHRFYAYLKSGDFERALADLREAGRLESATPRDLKRAEAEILYRRGCHYMAFEDWKKAIGDLNAAKEDFDAAEKTDPGFSRQLGSMREKAYYQFGRQSFYKGDYPDAIEKLGAAIDLNGFNAQYFYYRGMAYYKNCQQKEALGDFASSVSLDNDLQRRIPRQMAQKIQTVAKPIACE
jgi:tetratricopeptide (TPR) repeat protein